MSVCTLYSKRRHRWIKLLTMNLFKIIIEFIFDLKGMGLGGVCFNANMSDECLEQLLDKVPQLHEVCSCVGTAHWYELGVQLQLNTVDLDEIRDSAVTDKDKLSRMYDVWLNKRADGATRRSLLTALQSDHVGQKRIAVEYKEKLMTVVSVVNTGLL